MLTSILDHFQIISSLIIIRISNMQTLENSNLLRHPEEKTCRFNLSFLRLITVEPTMFLYMMAFMLTTVIEQALFVYKACKVNHGFNETVCENINLKKYSEEHKIVQITVSSFHQWNDIAGHVVPIILAFFMGAWSDRRGRKLPLLLGLIGKCYYSIMIVVNVLMVSWPVEYIIYTATFPSALTGADVAIFAAAFSYISDVTTSKKRTIRVTILDVVYLSTMPIGIALGAYLFNKVVNKSYAIMFGINSSLLILSIIYTLAVLEWRTNEKQRPWREADNMLTDFFDKDHVVQSVNILVKKRPDHKRTFLLVFILTMALYTFQRDEKPMAYLYLSSVFEWDPTQFSAYKTFQSTFQVVAMLIGIPVMSKLLHLSDTVIMMVGALAHSAARVVFALAPEAWYFFIGGTLSSLGPVVAPALRARVSKLVPVVERGKVFSLLSVADNAIPLVSGTMYTQVYNHTINTQPNAIFYLTMATQMAVFALTMFVHCFAKSGALDDNSEEDRKKLEAETLTVEA